MLLLFRAGEFGIEHMQFALDFAEAVGVPFIHLRVVGEKSGEVCIWKSGYAGSEQPGVCAFNTPEAEFGKRVNKLSVILPMNFCEMDDFEPGTPPCPGFKRPIVVTGFSHGRELQKIAGHDHLDAAERPGIAAEPFAKEVQKIKSAPVEHRDLVDYEGLRRPDPVEPGPYGESFVLHQVLEIMLVRFAGARPEHHAAPPMQGEPADVEGCNAG